MFYHDKLRPIARSPTLILRQHYFCRDDRFCALSEYDYRALYGVIIYYIQPELVTQEGKVTNEVTTKEIRERKNKKN